MQTYHGLKLVADVARLLHTALFSRAAPEEKVARGVGTQFPHGCLECRRTLLSSLLANKRLFWKDASQNVFFRQRVRDFHYVFKSKVFRFGSSGFNELANIVFALLKIERHSSELIIQPFIFLLTQEFLAVKLLLRVDNKVRRLTLLQGEKTVMRVNKLQNLTFGRLGCLETSY